jgi:hypothetical protein
MDVSINTEHKQTYLRSEIMDKGYDTSDFVEFLISIKGEDAGNVENWTIEELEQVVSDFKSTRERRSKRPSVTHNIVPENYNVDKYEDIITCNKQEKTPLSDCHNIEIIISE